MDKNNLILGLQHFHTNRFDFWRVKNFIIIERSEEDPYMKLIIEKKKNTNE